MFLHVYAEESLLLFYPSYIKSHNTYFIFGRWITLILILYYVLYVGQLSILWNGTDDVLSGYWNISWNVTCQEIVDEFVSKIDTSQENVNLCVRFYSVLCNLEGNMEYE